MNLNTKSILLEESVALQISWLENDIIEGIDSNKAKLILENLKSSKSVLFNNGEINYETEFLISMSFANFNSITLMLNHLNVIGIVMEYSTNYCSNGNIYAEFRIMACKDLSSDGPHSASTKITNSIIKELGFIESDYKITSFTKSYY